MGLPTISKSSVVGGVGLFLSGLWRVYSYYTTAASLPDDVGAVWKMVADPPVYLPWLFMAGFAILLGWAIWPKKGTDGVADDDGKGGGDGNTTHGDGSHIFSGNFNAPVSVKPPTRPQVNFNDSLAINCGTLASVPEGVDVNVTRTTITGTEKVVEVRDRKDKK